jgi:hypothetical protein
MSGVGYAIMRTGMTTSLRFGSFSFAATSFNNTRAMIASGRAVEALFRKKLISVLCVVDGWIER